MSPSKTGEINLKHRVTGAAVLIFFGALVLPWLLGPPSDAQKHGALVDNAQSATRDQIHSTFEDEVLAEIEGINPDFKEPEETVYVSKITPLDVDQPKPEKEPDKQPVSDKKPATVTKEGANTNAPKTTTSKPEPKSSETKSGSVAKAVEEAKQSAPKAPVKVEPKPVAKPKIDVGWVVQVELLVDKKGAARLVDDLKSKGFDPQTTIVDTNRGKNTGTRIWLGPFENRTQAGTENERLKAKMGKGGFIRVYP